jgi:hypothetical protein
MKRFFLLVVSIFLLTGFSAAVASDASDIYDKAIRHFKRG